MNFSAWLMRHAEMQTTAATEWGWLAGRIALIAIVAVGNQAYLSGTRAYPVLLAGVVFVLLYSGLLALLLKQGRVRQVMLLGLLLDTIAVGSCWWATKLVLTSPSDLYLALFPIIVIGIMRLGWPLGAGYALFWIAWMIGLTLAYDEPGSYPYQQLPLRVVFMLVTAVLALRLMAVITKDRRDEQSRLEELERFEWFKNDLLLSISHQLRTPLSTVKASADILASSLEQLSEEQRSKSLQVLYHGVNRLERLVQRTLDYVQFESGQDVRIQPVSLDQLLEDVVSQMRPDFEARRITLVLNVPDFLPEVMVDRRLTRRVFLELLDNALKFSPEAGRITVSASAGSSYMCVNVQDEGPGVSRAEQQFIFSGLYRGSRADRHSNEGLGLGLTLARQIVERLGGSIALESKDGTGTTLSVALPVAANASQPVRSQPQNCERRHRERSGKAGCASPASGHE